MQRQTMLTDSGFSEPMQWYPLQSCVCLSAQRSRPFNLDLNHDFVGKPLLEGVEIILNFFHLSDCELVESKFSRDCSIAFFKNPQKSPLFVPDKMLWSPDLFKYPYSLNNTSPTQHLIVISWWQHLTLISPINFLLIVKVHRLFLSTDTQLINNQI